MKKHNTVKIVMICLAAFLLLSWILPAAYFQTSYVAQDRVQMGLFDIFNYPVTALQYFGHIMLYVLVIGAFYGVLNRISAYRVVLDKLAKKFKAHGTLLIAVIMMLFAVITSICGLTLGNKTTLHSSVNIISEDFISLSITSLEKASLCFI